MTVSHINMTKKSIIFIETQQINNFGFAGAKKIRSLRFYSVSHVEGRRIKEGAKIRQDERMQFV